MVIQPCESPGTPEGAQPRSDKRIAAITIGLGERMV
jgi:hypothetical protein